MSKKKENKPNLEEIEEWSMPRHVWMTALRKAMKWGTCSSAICKIRSCYITRSLLSSSPLPNSRPISASLIFLNRVLLHSFSRSIVLFIYSCLAHFFSFSCHYLLIYSFLWLLIIPFSSYFFRFFQFHAYSPYQISSKKSKNRHDKTMWRIRLAFEYTYTLFELMRKDRIHLADQLGDRENRKVMLIMAFIIHPFASVLPPFLSFVSFTSFFYSPPYYWERWRKDG